jgi:ATP-dependent RNA helicase RhlE
MTMTFKELNLNNALWNALDDMKLEHPTTIQSKAIPVIMSGRDVCGIAQTGTGKTLAYLIPLLRTWTYNKNRHAQILIIVPTRELVVQVVEQAVALAKYTNCVIKGVYGGANLRIQAADIAGGCDVIIGTPGRIMDLGYHGSINMKSIKKFVIDEMDEMLALGFRTQITQIMDMLSEKRQNLLFSATITEEVDEMIDDKFDFPERVEAAPSGTPLESIDQYVYRVPNFNTKVNLLKYLLGSSSDMSKVLLFVSTKALADELYETITESYPDNIGLIHSNKEQNYRFNAVNGFKSGQFRVLIATDIVSRGIDISDVSHVINFDMPDDAESYIHRIGRTGRADRHGVAISIIGDQDVEMLEAVQNLMSKEVEVLAHPEAVEISDILRESEKPQVFMRNTLAKVKLSGGAAFHEKKDKNTKINTKVRHSDKMHAKYGKPKTRGQKGRKK